jgi:hypothetical protein
MVTIDKKAGSNPVKGYFMRTLAVPRGFLPIRVYLLRQTWTKNCANSIKKLLLLTDLTIIIKGLVVRINSYQS